MARHGTRKFISTVHKLNKPMRAINAKLQALEMMDPVVSEHFLTLVKAEPLIKPGDVAPSE